MSPIIMSKRGWVGTMVRLIFGEGFKVRVSQLHSQFHNKFHHNKFTINRVLSKRFLWWFSLSCRISGRSWVRLWLLWKETKTNSSIKLGGEGHVALRFLDLVLEKSAILNRKMVGCVVSALFPISSGEIIAKNAIMLSRHPSLDLLDWTNGNVYFVRI